MTNNNNPDSGALCRDPSFHASVVSPEQFNTFERGRKIGLSCLDQLMFNGQLMRPIVFEGELRRMVSNDSSSLITNSEIQVKTDSKINEGILGVFGVDSVSALAEHHYFKALGLTPVVETLGRADSGTDLHKKAFQELPVIIPNAIVFDVGRVLL